MLPLDTPHRTDAAGSTSETSRSSQGWLRGWGHRTQARTWRRKTCGGCHAPQPRGQCGNRHPAPLCLNTCQYSRLRFLGDHRILPISAFTPRLSTELQDRPSPWTPPASMWELSPCHQHSLDGVREMGPAAGCRPLLPLQHPWPHALGSPASPPPDLWPSPCPLPANPEGCEGPPGSSGHGCDHTGWVTSAPDKMV